MTTLQVQMGKETCEILISSGILRDCGQQIGRAVRGRCAVVVTDSNCKTLFGDIVMQSLQEAGFSTAIIALPAGETTKSIPMLSTLYTVFANMGLSSVDVVVALGGGVIFDLAGMAAATYQAGLPMVAIPTTLVSQLSSPVGGKVSIDLPEGKNLVGLYYQPEMVLVDPALLSGISKNGISDGIAELVKYAATIDAALFEHLEHQKDLVLPDLIIRCLESKATFLETDLREQGARHLLNFGTTLGNAYERLNGFMSNSYGASLAAGMAQIAQIGVALGVTPDSVAQRLTSVLQRHNLPTKMDFSEQEVFKIALLDKKRYGGTFNLVLLRQFGQPIIHPVSSEHFLTLLHQL